MLVQAVMAKSVMNIVKVRRVNSGASTIYQKPEFVSSFERTVAPANLVCSQK